MARGPRCLHGRVRLRLVTPVALAFAALAAACGSDGGTTTDQAADPVVDEADVKALESIDGVVVEAVTGSDHVDGDLDYPDSPPSGGDHNAVWQNCGFYDAPVFDERAVHALEHGVTWLAYSPDLSDQDVAVVREAFDLSDGRAIASPYPGVDVLEVVAWKHRLVVDDVNDPRVAAFVEAARSGAQSPEPGASCEGGDGEVSETGKA